MASLHQTSTPYLGLQRGERKKNMVCKHHLHFDRSIFRSPKCAFAVVRKCWRRTNCGAALPIVKRSIFCFCCCFLFFSPTTATEPQREVTIISHTVCCCGGRFFFSRKAKRIEGIWANASSNPTRKDTRAPGTKVAPTTENPRED